MIHARKLKNDPKIEYLDQARVRITCDFINIGQSLADRLLRFFQGLYSQLEFTVCSGNIVLAKTTLGKTVNYMYICTVPHSSGCHAYIVPFRKGQKNFWYYFSYPIQRWKNFIRRKFIDFFFRSEATGLSGVKINPGNLVQEEKVLLDYLYWLSELLARHKKVLSEN
jgi:hypothetical protein